MEVQDSKTWVEMMEEFNDSYQTFLTFGRQAAISFWMFIKLFWDAFGQVTVLVVFSIVEHHRIQSGANGFMPSDYAFLMGIGFVALYITIPFKSVDEKKRNGTLQFKEVAQKKVSGFTLVKFVRWLRFFFGVWEAGNLWGIYWDKLPLDMYEEKSSLEKLETLTIIIGSMLAMMSSLMEIEGVVNAGDTDAWYIGLYKVFATTNMNTFFPAFGATIVTFVVAVVMTSISREIALNLAMNDMIRETKKIERIEKKLTEGIVTVLEASTLDTRRNGFWTNLQNIEGIDINLDKVNTVDDSLNFFDSQNDMWISEMPYSTTTTLRTAIIKHLKSRE